MSCVYDSLIQHTQLNGNLTIVTVFKHVHDLKLKPSKTTVHSSVSLSHTHTHTLTLEQETNLFVNQPLTQMFFFFFFLPLKNPPATFLLHKPTNFRKQPLNDGCSPVDSTQLAARNLPKFGCWLASVSHPIQHAPEHKYKLKIPQIHIYTNRSGPSNAGARLTIYNASFLYMPRIKLF